MKIVLIVLSVLLITGCGDEDSESSHSSDCSPGSFCEQILNSHNKVRQLVNAGDYHNQPAPKTAIPDLIWDEKLARVAHNYGKKCHWGHNGDRTEDYAALGGEGYVGENLAVSSNQPSTDQTVDAQWGAEAKDYTYSSKSCSGVCGHYTQIVWAKTTRVGCAIIQCDSFTGGLSWGGYITVCNYAPGGNFNGEHPY